MKTATQRARHDRSLELGQRLRELRQQRGQTIRDVARDAQISVGILSLVERGQSQPSIGTLGKICDALAVSIHDVVPPGKSQGRPAKITVVRAGERVATKLGDRGIAKEYLTPYRDFGLRLLRIAFPPRSESSQMMVGPGEKAGYVVSGEMTLTVEETVLRLRAGDSFQFPSSDRHSFGNPTDDVTEIVWIMNMAEGSF